MTMSVRAATSAFQSTEPCALAIAPSPLTGMEQLLPIRLQVDGLALLAQDDLQLTGRFLRLRRCLHLLRAQQAARGVMQCKRSPGAHLLLVNGDALHLPTS